MPISNFSIKSFPLSNLLNKPQAAGRKSRRLAGEKSFPQTPLLFLPTRPLFWMDLLYFRYIYIKIKRGRSFFFPLGKVDRQNLKNIDMKKILKLFLLVLILVFFTLILTFATGWQSERPNIEFELNGQKHILYGENTYIHLGFPLEFFILCSGFCGYEPFNYLYFFIDFAIWFAVLYFVYFLYKKIKVARNKKI